MTSPIVYPILIMRAAGLGLESSVNLVSESYIALGIGTMLQCYPGRYIGSGFLLPFIFTAAYLPATLLAVQAGGMPLVMGMTLFAGAVQAALAWIVPRFPWLFPAEISGLCITLIGLVLGILGVRLLLGDNPVPGSLGLSSFEFGIGAAALALMITLQIWGIRSLQTYAVILSIAAGYLASLALGTLDPVLVSEIGNSVLLRLPRPALALPAFRFDFAIPFAVGALACCLRAMGDLTMCQKINNRDWVRPDFASIRRGVFADAIGTMISALIGSIGGNTFSGGVGLSSATRITSWRIGFFIGFILIAIGMLPKFLAILVSIPKPITGAALVFTSSFILINGLKILMDRLLDSRRILLIGIALMLSISRDVLPDFYDHLPASLQPFVMSDMELGVVSALVLNALFRIGIKQRRSIKVKPGARAAEEVQIFLEEQGSRWSARRDVMARAVFGTLQTLEVVFEQMREPGPVTVQATFDEYNLDITISYVGEPIELSEKRPSDAEIVESEAGARRLAGYLIRRNADRVDATTTTTGAIIKLHFDH
jgi:NCS2 family nucleobase:cation symporter-2